MHALSPTDLTFVVGRLPRDVRDIVKSQGLFVGGGFIRETIAGNPAQDVDVFGPSAPGLEAAAVYLCGQRAGSRAHKTPNAITVLSTPRLPVQFITRWCFEDPQAVVESFDFTVCQAVIGYDKAAQAWFSRIGEGFYRDLAARRLVYTHPVREEAAGGSLLRVRKFLARGYTIQAGALAGVISRLVMAVDRNRASSEEEVAFVLKGLLHEVDPIHAIDGVEILDEHQVAVDEGMSPL